MSETKAKYKYVKLNTLKVPSKVDVYGVVKFFKPPYKTKGIDYCTMVSIIDESFTDPMEKLKCLLFNRESENLPSCKVGQILRLHRLSISEYNGSLQAQNGPGFSWVLFSGEVDSSLDPIKTSSAQYSIEDTDNKRIVELRKWASQIDELKEKLNSFQDVAPGCYFDILCQVVYTSVIEDGIARLLKVWDGTNTVFQCRKAEFDSQEDVQKDKKLMKIAEGFLYNVMVYDDHFKPSGCIKPGDFIKITNLHAVEHNDKDDGTAVEFDLHRGTGFGRGVRIVNPAGPDLAELKTRLEMITEQYGNIESDNEETNKDEANTQDMVDILNSLDGNSKDASTKKASLRDEEPVPSTSGLNKKYNNANEKKGQGHSATEGQGQSTSKITQVQRKTEESRGSSTSKDVQNDKVPEVILGHCVSEVSQGQGVSEVSQCGSDVTISNCVQSNVGTSADCTSEESEISISNDTYNDNDSKTSKRKKSSSDQSQNVSNPTSKNAKKLKKSQTDKSIVSEDDKTDGSQMDIDELRELVINDVCPEISLDSAQKVKDTESVPSSLRCMVETNTVVLNHPLLVRSRIKDILNHQVPDVFRIRAKVYDYHPKFTKATNFLQLYCSTCEYLSPHPNANANHRLKLQRGSTFNGVPHYNCPTCYKNKDSLEGLDSPPHLKYIYMMRFILYDDTEMLIANVWREDAELLFQNIEPESLLKDKNSVELLKEQLSKICPRNMKFKDRPKIECCVKSYTACGKTNFQIFDTSVV
ncbi:3-ketoacyl-CoA thiolase with broad chain length specificity [Mactra antiquata]